MPRLQRPEAADQLPRQWSLYRLLFRAGAAGLTVRELAEQLHTHKANVERDLQALAAAGFPLRSQKDPGHAQRLRWILDGEDGVGAAGFGPAELLSLHAASAALQFLANTPVHMDLQAVLSKVRASLAGAKGKTVAGTAHVFVPHLRDFVSYDADDLRAILDDLLDAMARHRMVRVEYLSADARRPKPATLLPLRLFAHHNSLYLLAQRDGKNEVRTYAVHRIRWLEVTDAPFDEPRVDLAAHVEHAFGVFIEPPTDVEVRFAPEVARYVTERTFHPREEKLRLEDGSIRYRVRAGGRLEIVAWVLGFGGAAELVSPAEWRADVLRGAERLRAAHSR
ncbi:MAG: WYL domain-containing transcriptional regulator [Deltaproteobacteria bacterium]|nr:WYL domain-containing transcriptional regulator [Deltaproteobacteria bacterium]